MRGGDRRGGFARLSAETPTVSTPHRIVRPIFITFLHFLALSMFAIIGIFQIGMRGAAGGALERSEAPSGVTSPIFFIYPGWFTLPCWLAVYAGLHTGGVRRVGAAERAREDWGGYGGVFPLRFWWPEWVSLLVYTRVIVPNHFRVLFLPVFLLLWLVSVVFIFRPLRG